MRKKTGFTIIELLVVIALIMIITAFLANLFFSTLKGSIQTTVINEVKQNGDYAMSVIERIIRNSVAVPAVCDSLANQSITITNSDESLTTISCPIGSDSRLSATGTTMVYLTTSKVRVLPFPSCYFKCTQNDSYSPAMVSISFTVAQPAPPVGVTLRPEESMSLDYKTSVVIRNTGF